MLKNILLSFVLLIVSSAAVAHGGGHGPVSEKQAMQLAVDTARQFVTFDAGLGFGKLATSWNSVSTADTRLHKKGNGYYIFSIRNQADDKTLYVLVSTEGEVYDANFSGEFKGLK